MEESNDRKLRKGVEGQRGVVMQKGKREIVEFKGDHHYNKKTA